jgi:[ribosomal protein S5]-alanine N-acetyltransferase
VEARDQEEFVALARASVELHGHWITTATAPETFAAYLSRFDGRTQVGLVICLRATGGLAGFVNFRDIAAGRGTIGFGAFAPTAGAGYMREGLRLALAYAFDDLGLEGIAADIQPGNTACRHLVERLGFGREASAPTAILIRGVWRDHDRWTITRKGFADLR